MIKKSYLISILIHIAFISVIFFYILYSEKILKDDVKHDFNITINAYDFSHEIIVNKSNIVHKQNIVDNEKKEKVPLNNNELGILENSTETDNSKFEEEYYLNIMNGKVDGIRLSMPEYPENAKRLGYEGVAIVDITINKLGEIKNVYLVKSSGHNILDKEVILTIKRKWKKLPKPSKEITVSKAFEFEILH